MPQDMTRDGGAMRPATWNAEARTFECVVSKGGAQVLRQASDGSLYHEELAIEGADLTLIVGAPLLDSHKTEGVAHILGTIEAAWVAGGDLVARCRVDDDQEKIAAMIARGTISAVSVGYDILEAIELPDAGPDGITRILVKRWAPREVSLVPVPADPGAKIRSRSEVPMTAKRAEGDEPAKDLPAGQTPEEAAAAAAAEEANKAAAAAEKTGETSAADANAQTLDALAACIVACAALCAAKDAPAACVECLAACLAAYDAMGGEDTDAIKSAREMAKADPDAAAEGTTGDAPAGDAPADDAKADTPQMAEVRSILRLAGAYGVRMAPKAHLAHLLRADPAKTRADLFAALSSEVPDMSSAVPPAGTRADRQTAGIDTAAIYARANAGVRGVRK